jgi:hypothetical protein
MRVPLTVLASLTCLLLSACPDSLFQPLPAGSAQGAYAGQFLASDESTVLGTLSLQVDTAGAVTGSGQVDGRSVELAGTVAAGKVVVYLTDTLNGLAGRLRGDASQAVLGGDFELARPAGQEQLEGYWECAPQG